MPFVSKDEKEILKLLILYSALFLLTEKEALEYIKEKLGKTISRRRYYYYRSQLGLQTLDTYSLFRYLQNEDFLNNVYSKKNYEYYPNPNYVERILDKSNRIIRNSIFDTAELFKDLNSDIQTSEKNLKDIPSKATIREEYVNCSKPYCKTLHGPYYYGYWRDNNRNNKKLYKKYIGKVDPRENKNNGEFNRNVSESLLSLKNHENKFVNKV